MPALDAQRSIIDPTIIAAAMQRVLEAHGKASIYVEPQPGAYQARILTVDSQAGTFTFEVTSSAREASCPPRLLVWQSTVPGACIEFHTQVPDAWTQRATGTMTTALPRIIVEATRRSEPRAPIAQSSPILCRIELDRRSQPIKAAALDISASGLALSTSGEAARELEQANELRITLELPSIGEFRAVGVASYISPGEAGTPYRVGVRIIEQAAADAILLRRFLAAFAATDAATEHAAD